MPGNWDGRLNSEGSAHLDKKTAKLINMRTRLSHLGMPQYLARLVLRRPCGRSQRDNSRYRAQASLIGGESERGGEKWEFVEVTLQGRVA